MLSTKSDFTQINRLLDSSIGNVHFKFELKIPKQTEVMLMNQVVYTRMYRQTR